MYLFYTSDSGSVYGKYDITILSNNLNGDVTTESAVTASSAPATTGGGTGLWFTGLSGLNLLGEKYKFYYIHFKRNAVLTGESEYIHKILYTVTVDSVEAIGGLT